MQVKKKIQKTRKPPGVVLSNIYYFVGVIPGSERSCSRDLELIIILYGGKYNFQIRVYIVFRVIERRTSFFSQLLMECIFC